MSLLDTASARITLTQGAKPQVTESLEQTIRYQKNEKAALEKENALFGITEEETKEITGEIETNESELEALNVRWKQEVELVDQIKALQKGN